MRFRWPWVSRRRHEAEIEDVIARIDRVMVSIEDERDEWEARFRAECDKLGGVV